MAKITILMTALVFAFGFLVPNVFADDQAAITMGKPSAFSSMVGTSVFSPRGEYLGRISDFVMDSHGKLAFAVVSPGGFLRIREKDVAVPYDSFPYDRQKGRFVLDVTPDRLNRAPMFSRQDLYSEKWSKDVYRYFGQAPYWTEGEFVEKGVKPREEPFSGFDESFYPYGQTP